MTALNLFTKILQKNYLVFASIIVFGVTNIVVSSGQHMVHRVFSFIFIVLILKRISSTVCRYLLAIPLMVLTAADISISLYAWCTFGTKFNDGFAVSVLQSNPDEIVQMLGVYLSYFFVFILLFSLFLASVRKYDGTLPTKKVTGTLLLVLLSISLFSSYRFASKYVEGKETINSYIVASRFSTYTPFFNLNYFALAMKEFQTLKSIAKTVPHYQLTVTDTGIENYVVIVGESARVDNMSIYGYGKPTTPQLEAQKACIKLFTQAIGGAPHTALAVPLALTADEIQHHDIHNYPDNIINMANQAGFHTTWLSAQSAFRQRGTAVTSIAMRAKDSVYVRGYDELLLPHLEEALQENPSQKKLIVLHLRGSHAPVCGAYPTNKAAFQPHGDKDVCYDNSIHYTDSLLGQVFELLKDTRSSVMYFSDHGLERDPSTNAVYFHGGIKPSQQAYHVPMFIWFSPTLGDDVDTATVKDIYSTTYNDILISAWMGATKPEQPKTIGDVIERHKGNTRVMDGNYDELDYLTLRKTHTGR